MISSCLVIFIVASDSAGISAWKERILILMNHASQAPVGHHECHETHFEAANRKILTSCYQWTLCLIKKLASDNINGALNFGKAIILT